MEPAIRLRQAPILAMLAVVGGDGKAFAFPSSEPDGAPYYSLVGVLPHRGVARPAAQARAAAASNPISSLISAMSAAATSQPLRFCRLWNLPMFDELGKALPPEGIYGATIEAGPDAACIHG